MTTPSSAAMRAANAIKAAGLMTDDPQTDEDVFVAVRCVAEIVDHCTKLSRLMDAANTARDQFQYMLDQMGHDMSREPYTGAGSEVLTRIEELDRTLSAVRGTT